MNVIFGIDAKIGAAISAIIAIAIFASKSAGKAMDKLTQILGALMIIVILVVVFISQPPVGEAVYRTFVPDHFPVLAIVTLVGGTVGGYITFSGGHRLLDAGVSGEENLGKVTRSATTGMGVATIVRILFFLAVLGVVSKGMQLDPKNPPASAFQLAAGTMGYKFFGIVLLAAAISSVVGAAYTSVSFLTSMSKAVKERQNLFVIAFITVSTLIFIFIGNPVKLLIVAGSLNGLILPITLGAMLLASRNKKIVGDYKHPTFLLILGVIVVVVVAYLGIKSLSGLSKLFVPAK